MCEQTKNCPAPGNQSGTGPSATISPIVASPTNSRWFLSGYDVGENVGERRGWIMGRRRGYAEGFEDGYEQAAEDFDSRFRDRQTDTYKALVDHVNTRGPFATAAAKRGQHDRADHQIQALHERGIL